MQTSKQLSIGTISIETAGGYITRLFLPCEAISAPPPPPNSIAERAFQQLEEYLQGKRHTFNLPLSLTGCTPLQKEILQRIAAIPYGKTATYSSLGPPRMVGHTCAINPLPLFIPCHRVVPKQNPPGQYRGGAVLKKRLLSLETLFEDLPINPSEITHH